MKQSSSSVSSTHMISFNDTLALLKSYLSQKRYSYVYEEATKYYEKNAAIANHQVLQITEIISFVLRKKFNSKVSPKLKFIDLDSIRELFKLIGGTFLSWESILNLQMNSEKATFFQMLCRHTQQRKIQRIFKGYQQIVQRKSLNLQPGQINIQKKLHNFLKQSVEMAISAMIVSSLNLENCPQEQLISCMQKAEKILNTVPEQNFAEQKAKFFIVKCQIVDQLDRCIANRNELKTKIKTKIIQKSHFEYPFGLFQGLYLNIDKWNEKKINQKIKLLFQIIFMGLKVQIISIQQAYFLSQEIKLLILTIQSKYRSESKKIDNHKQNATSGQNSFRRPKDSNNSKQKMAKAVLHHEFVNDDSGSNLRKKIERYEKFVRKIKNRFISILTATISEIQIYIQSRRQVGVISKIYLLQLYYRYKESKFQENDQIADEIVTLQKEKSRIHRNKQSLHAIAAVNNPRQSRNSTDSNSLGLQSQQNSSFPVSSLTLKLNSQKKNNSLIDHPNYLPSEQKAINFSRSSPHSPNTDTKGANLKSDAFILKNIKQVKQTQMKTKLTLDRKRNTSEFLKNQLKNEKDQIQSKQIQQKCDHLKSYSKMIHSNLLKQVSPLKVSFKSPVAFFDESDSDSEAEISHKFQKQRKQEILRVNSLFFKNTNSNYFSSSAAVNQSQTSDKFFLPSLQTENIDLLDDPEKLSASDKKLTKIDQNLVFEEIKLLDEVIRDRILQHISLQLSSLNSDSPNCPKKYCIGTFEQLQKCSCKNNLKDGKISEMSRGREIVDYREVLSRTEGLKEQVERLNKERKLLIDKLKYNRNLDKMTDRYSTSYQNECSIEDEGANYEQVLRDLHNIYNTKNNLNERASGSIKLYEKLLRMSSYRTSGNFKGILNQAIQKYAESYKEYCSTSKKIAKLDLSVVREDEGDDEEQKSDDLSKTNSHRNKNQEINLIEYIITNRPKSELEERVFASKKKRVLTLESKAKEQFLSQKDKGCSSSNEIAIRDQFDKLRGNICKSQFDKNSSSLGQEITMGKIKY